MTMTPIRLEILLCISDRLRANKKVSVTLIARAIQHSKSTVSRTIDSLMKDHILEEGLVFTPQGLMLSELYVQGRSFIADWLQANSFMDREEAKSQALIWMSSITQTHLSQLVQSVHLQTQKLLIQEMDSFQEMDIKGLLEEGNYPVGFNIYNHKEVAKGKLSMANNGFHHPATLVIRKEGSYLLLKSKLLMHKLPKNLGVMQGMVSKVEYYEQKKIVPAIKDGFFWQIPLEAIRFSFNKGENMFAGTLEVVFTCRSGLAFMPASRAILVLTLSINDSL